MPSTLGMCVVVSYKISVGCNGVQFKYTRYSFLKLTKLEYLFMVFGIFSILKFPLCDITLCSMQNGGKI